MGTLPARTVSQAADGSPAVDSRGADLVFAALGTRGQGKWIASSAPARLEANAAGDSNLGVRDDRTAARAQATGETPASHAELGGWMAAAGAIGWFAVKDSTNGEDAHRPAAALRGRQTGRADSVAVSPRIRYHAGRDACAGGDAVRKPRLATIPPPQFQGDE